MIIAVAHSVPYSFPFLKISCMAIEGGMFGRSSNPPRDVLFNTGGCKRIAEMYETEIHFEKALVQR